MPQIETVSAYGPESGDKEAVIFPRNNSLTELYPAPSSVSLIHQLQEGDKHLYDDPNLKPGRLADKSVILAQLIANGQSSYQEQFVSCVSCAEREATKLAETHTPHLSWQTESYLHIFIDQKNLEPQSIEYANLDTRESMVGTESDTHLDYRRGSKQQELEYAVEHVRTTTLIDLLKKMVTSDDNPSPTTPLERLMRMTNSPENEPVTWRTSGNKIAQARSALDAGMHETGEMRNNLLNLALDTSTNALDALPEAPTVEKAAAYLIAATSVHDLASQPDSFLPRLEEHEARDFRVRALEIAAYWANQAATTYRELFGSPVGDITPESLAGISRTMAAVRDNTEYINDAFWFENVYEKDYTEATKTLDHRVRNIGQGAVILALKQPRPSDQTPVPQANERAKVA